MTSKVRISVLTLSVLIVTFIVAFLVAGAGDPEGEQHRGDPGRVEQLKSKGDPEQLDAPPTAESGADSGTSPSPIPPETNDVAPTEPGIAAPAGQADKPHPPPAGAPPNIDAGIKQAVDL
jgi:hypothetical protein